MILAGVQILYDNVMQEHFKWKNKEKILHLIEKYRKSNVVFLSGDIHRAQVIRTPCAAVGGYRMMEYTSSGMTHGLRSQVGVLAHFLSFWEHPMFLIEEPVDTYNYGDITVDTLG